MTVVKLFEIFWAMLPSLLSSPLQSPCIRYDMVAEEVSLEEDVEVLAKGPYFSVNALTRIKLCRGAVPMSATALAAALLHELGHFDQLVQQNFLANTPQKAIVAEAYADEFMFAHLGENGLDCGDVSAFLDAYRAGETKGEALARELMVNAFGRWADPHGGDDSRVAACKAALGPD